MSESERRELHQMLPGLSAMQSVHLATSGKAVESLRPQALSITEAPKTENVKQNFDRRGLSGGLANSQMTLLCGRK
jgi:hypothetical protein